MAPLKFDFRSLTIIPGNFEDSVGFGKIVQDPFIFSDDRICLLSDVINATV